MGQPMTPIYVSGIVPLRMHDTDAAFDICAEEPCFVGAGQRRLVNAGFRIEIPERYVGLVCSRSGMALRDGVIVLNAPGVIDPGYRGDVGVILYNTSSIAWECKPGDRIAQLLIVPNSSFRLVSSFADDLSDTARGSGGFGSTGINHDDEEETTDVWRKLP